jgi:hypothetical protein
VLTIRSSPFYCLVRFLLCLTILTRSQVCHWVKRRLRSFPGLFISSYSYSSSHYVDCDLPIHVDDFQTLTNPSLTHLCRHFSKVHTPCSSSKRLVTAMFIRRMLLRPSNHTARILGNAQNRTLSSHQYVASFDPSHTFLVLLIQWGATEVIADITQAADWEILSCDPQSLAQDIRIVCKTADSTGCDHLFATPSGAPSRLAVTSGTLSTSAADVSGTAWPSDGVEQGSVGKIVRLPENVCYCVCFHV